MRKLERRVEEAGTLERGNGPGVASGLSYSFVMGSYRHTEVEAAIDWTMKSKLMVFETVAGFDISLQSTS